MTLFNRMGIVLNSLSVAMHEIADKISKVAHLNIVKNHAICYKNISI